MQQQHATTGWEAACMSLMDSDLPALNIPSPPPEPMHSNISVQPVVSGQALAPDPAIQQPSKVELPAVPVPTDLNSIFERYRQLGAEIARLVSVHQQTETSLFGSTFTSNVSLDDETNIARSAIRTLIHQAEQMYAPPGGSLSIHHSEVMDALGLDNWEGEYSEIRQSAWRGSRIRGLRRSSEIPQACTNIENFLDLKKIQAYLERTYGGEAGVRRGLSQAAAEIIGFFGLQRNEAVTRVKSGFILSTRVYSTKKDYGEHNGMYSPYSSDNTRTKALQALETFFKHANLHSLFETGIATMDFTNHYFHFAPREKRILPGLEISFFKEEWKFKFQSDTAEKLMLFLGEFGSDQ
ncbi:hypothetical protein LPN04_29660 [Rugamonas sp. A1-17]|nr:hypothetical protein [Rugamonas sp. A1-17]